MAIILLRFFVIFLIHLKTIILATCEAGYYGRSQGQFAACKPCSAGTYSSSGSTACSLCPTNTYSLGASSLCFNCTQWSFSMVGSSACTCLPRYYSVNEGSTLRCFNYPTGQPSRQPISRPSRKPRGFPTHQPSTTPTLQPSSGPSQAPTVRPTVQPTVQPTLLPSSQPAVQPTATPSRNLAFEHFRLSRPSSQPSASPTFTPSRQAATDSKLHPSIIPSSNPSTSPTQYQVPTSQPSSQPTRLPSTKPKSRPSRIPTTQPRTQPSRQPSSQPISSPTSIPVCPPTCRPSEQPSSRPSQQPLLRPSCHPIIQPSTEPSSQPLSMPSLKPLQRNLVVMHANELSAASICGGAIGGLITVATLLCCIIRFVRRAQIIDFKAVPVEEYFGQDRLYKTSNFKPGSVDAEIDMASGDHQGPPEIAISCRIDALITQIKLSSSTATDHAKEKNFSKLSRLLTKLSDEEEASRLRNPMRSSSKIAFPQTRINYAVLLVKPDAVTLASKRMIYSTLRTFCIHIMTEREWTGSLFNQNRIFEKQYRALSSISSARPPTLKLDASESKLFEATFGDSWKHCIAHNVVHNPSQACALLGYSVQTLCERWQQASRKVRLRRGFYCARLELQSFTGGELHHCPRGDDRKEKEGQKHMRRQAAGQRQGNKIGQQQGSSRVLPQYIICINGFYGSYRKSFIHEKATTAAMLLKWDATNLGWDEFQRDVVGDYCYTAYNRGPKASVAPGKGHGDRDVVAYDEASAVALAPGPGQGQGRIPDYGDNNSSAPATSMPAEGGRGRYPAGSLRARFSREWLALGLSAAPTEHSTLHASASAFEAMAERLLWRPVGDIASDPLAERLLAVVDLQTLKGWTRNALVLGRPAFNWFIGLGDDAVVEAAAALVNKAKNRSIDNGNYDSCPRGSEGAISGGADSRCGGPSGIVMSPPHRLGNSHRSGNDTGGHATGSGTGSSDKAPGAAQGDPTNHLTESAVILLKPGAATPAVCSMLKEVCNQHGVRITHEEWLPSPAQSEPTQAALTEQYHALISRALHVSPSAAASESITRSERKIFSSAFGLSWREAVKRERVCNAQEACSLLGLNLTQLNTVWASSRPAVRLGRGFYCTVLDLGVVLSVLDHGLDKDGGDCDGGGGGANGSGYAVRRKLERSLVRVDDVDDAGAGTGGDGGDGSGGGDGGGVAGGGGSTDVNGSKRIFCINGFYAHFRDSCLCSDAPVVCLFVEWDASVLSWTDFRDTVVGSRDPEAASRDAPASIRGRLACCERGRLLGLSAAPEKRGGNFVHVSASALEAMAERLRWKRGHILPLDPFSARLLAARCRIVELQLWMSQSSDVVVDGRRVLEWTGRQGADGCFTALMKLKKSNCS